MHISVKGLDAKQARAGRAPFHVTLDGVTTVSCSGFVLGRGQGEVLVCCSVAPLLLFLRGDARARPGSAAHADLAAEVTGHTAAGCSFPLHLLAVAGLPAVREGLQRLLAAPSTAGPGGWRLAWGALPMGEAVEAASHVALLRGHLGQGEALPPLLRPAPGERALGDHLRVEGAPFGALSPRHFEGYRVQGNLAARLQGGPPEAPCTSLLLLDLPGCLPGLEGGAVLDGGSEAWVGVLLGTMRDPVAQAHYALAAPAAAVLEAAAGALGRQAWSLPRLSGGGSRQPSCTEQALPAVVAVSTGGSWASGIVISPAGHVMTNAHLLRPSGGDFHADISALHASAPAPCPPVQVQVGGGSGRWVPAEVVHIFLGLDVAVLRLRPDSDRKGREWPAVQLSRSAVLEGQPVSLAGFAAFNPTSRVGPLVSAGYVTKVVRLLGSGEPAMVMTSAAVHSGASGGALLDPNTGQLVALATSNTRHSSTGELLPRLNWSIPASLLQPMFELANLTACEELRDPGAWSALEPDPAPLQEVWGGLGRAPDKRLGSERPRAPAALAALLENELRSKL